MMAKRAHFKLQLYSYSFESIKANISHKHYKNNSSNSESKKDKQ